MLAAGMPLPPSMQGAPTNDWNGVLIAAVVAVVLVVVAALYGWIVGRSAKPVRMRPTAVSRAVEERKAA